MNSAQTELLWIMAACAFALALIIGLAIGLTIGERRAERRQLKDDPGPQDDGAPWPPPEPVTIAAITPPGQMFRESSYAPRHAPTMARREIAFGGAFPVPKPTYQPIYPRYMHPIDRERLPWEEGDDGYIAWMNRIMAEHRVRHGLEA